MQIEKKYKYFLHVEYINNTKKYSSTCRSGRTGVSSLVLDLVLLSAGFAESLPPTREFATSSPSDRALPLFIAFLRRGHEVGGDAVSEVKTIRTTAIGPEFEYRLPTATTFAILLAGVRCHSETRDFVKPEIRL